MWFIYYELISFIICYIIITIVIAAIKNKLKRELNFTRKKVSFSEWLLGEIRVIFTCLIPILNIIMAIIYLFCYDKIYEKVKIMFQEK